jgi:hypothetical protein
MNEIIKLKKKKLNKWMKILFKMDSMHLNMNK